MSDEDEQLFQAEEEEETEFQGEDSSKTTVATTSNTSAGKSKQQQQQQAALFELYRKSTLGICLTDALNELINTDKISLELAHKVLGHFDKAMNKSLATQVTTKATFKGHLHTYRFCDNVWTLILENAKFKIENETVNVDKVKIVACDAKAFS